jgi:hypothetical protein
MLAFGALRGVSGALFATRAVQYSRLLLLARKRSASIYAAPASLPI